MDLFGVLDISASGLRAERIRAEVVAANLANAQSTRTPNGGPYRRQLVQFSSIAKGAASLPVSGVKVASVVASTTPLERRYQPGHPDADAEGYVNYPNINPIEEMVDLMNATRSYQLNAAAVQSTKSMIQSSLDLLR